MSEQTIAEKSLEIRQETQEFANTRGRVANVLDDINETKANKSDVVDRNELQNLSQSIDNKVDKTTTSITSPDATFKYAYIFDDNNNVRRMLAGDLGKNVANSALTSVANAGLTLAANWNINTAGFNFTIGGLTDVSNDSTFNTLLIQNPSGRVNKSNGKYPFINIPSVLSEQEKTNWKTAMNGGWTTSTMSVGAILPSVIPYQNASSWIVLRGANLNLNPANFSLAILNNSGVVVATIPNNQITLVSGSELSFYYNFHSLGVGQYKFRLNNGVAIYDTVFSLTVADNVVQLPIGSTVWNKKSYNDIDSPNQFANGGQIYCKTDANQKPLADENINVYKVKASNNFVFSNTDNFYIELNITAASYNGSTSSGTSVILANNSEINLADDSLIAIKLRGYGSSSPAMDVLGTLVGDFSNSSTITVKITKQGDQISIGYKGVKTNQSPYEGLKVTSIINTSNLYLAFSFGNKMSPNAEATINIITAYKF